MGNSGSRFLRLDGAESVRLAVGHSVDGHDGRIAGHKGDAVGAVRWNGPLKSNLVTLQIDRFGNLF